jgi:hypothetical protein
VYILFFIRETLAVFHLERSLLNAEAKANAIKSIHYTQNKMYEKREVSYTELYIYMKIENNKGYNNKSVKEFSSHCNPCV